LTKSRIKGIISQTFSLESPFKPKRPFTPLGDPALVSNGPLYLALAKLKQTADILGQGAFPPLDVYTVPGNIHSIKKKIQVNFREKLKYY
jgi:hypothetical protein